MKKCKITVIKSYVNQDLIDEFGKEGLTACTQMKVGDVFYADYTKPEGFCDMAWRAIYPTLFTLAHSEDRCKEECANWPYRKGVAVNTCGGGMRPVLFKIELMDEESDYIAIEKKE